MDKQPPSQPKEQEPAPFSFECIVQEQEKIYDAIMTSKNARLAYYLFEKPLRNLELTASKSSKSTFDLSAGIQLSAEDDLDDIVEAIVYQIADKDAEEKGGMYTFSGENGTKLLVGADYDTIWLTTGKVYGEDCGEPDSPYQLFAPQELTPENLNNSLSDYSQVLSAIITGAYYNLGGTPTSQEIYIKAPEKSLNARIGQAAIRGIKDITETLEVNVSGITFENIGGQQKAKTALEGLVFAVANPELYEQWGTTPPKGILLHGPPGTGKTLLAKALAAKADARFLHIKSSDIGSMWYGESERIMQGIFAYADRDGGKAIIYFDEIDTVVPQRDGSHEATQKVVGTLLQNIDGIDASSNITVIASTNRKDSIDSAMLRPGRLDMHVEVALPTKEERQEIFDVHIVKAERIAKRSLFEEVDKAILAEMTEKYSGADIAEVIRRTLEQKVRQEGMRLHPTPVTTADIIESIAAYEHVKNGKKRMGF